MMSREKLSLAIVVASGVAMAAQAQPSFTGLGSLSSDPSMSTATGVSADGRVVVGYSQTQLSPPKYAPFVWTLETGMLSLASDDGADPDARGLGISGDGRTVVGVAYISSALRAAKWLDGEGPTRLHASMPLSTTSSVSHDGAVIAGRQGENTGVIWTPSALVPLGNLPGHNRSFAHAVSADGRVVVGESFFSGDSANSRAFRWTEADGMRQVGSDASPDTMGAAYAVSADGSVIAGHLMRIAVPTIRQPAIWTEARGPMRLGSYAFDTYDPRIVEISGDGSVIGLTALDTFTSRDVAVIWTADLDQERLFDVLKQRCGLNLTGWARFTQVGGISADGKTIVGTGIHYGRTEAFVATLCDLPNCIVEYNGWPRAGDIHDYLDFMQDFGECTNLPAPCGTLGNADVNGDTIVDILDLLDFLDAMPLGCDFI